MIGFDGEAKHTIVSIGFSNVFHIYSFIVRKENLGLEFYQYSKIPL